MYLLCACCCLLISGYKFWRFDIRVVLAEAPGVLNYLVGLVGGQAPISSHSICLPARCVVGNKKSHCSSKPYALHCKIGWVVSERAAAAPAMHVIPGIGLPARCVVVQEHMA
jgi:hypothetical protein